MPGANLRTNYGIGKPVSTFTKVHYHPQTKFRRLRFHRCLSVHRGCLPPLHAGIHPRNQRQTPPRTRHLRDQTLPGTKHPPGPDTARGPPSVHAGRYEQQAGGTHSTGMHTCSYNVHNSAPCTNFSNLCLKTTT